MEKVSSRPRLSEMNYRVVRPLGNGAGSTILLISDKSSGGKRYALKVVKRQSADDDVYIAQARTEFEVAQRLNHPAIAKIHDIRVRRAWFRVSGVELLMEYVDGKTLDELETPTLRHLVLVFNHVAAAMAHMHRRGIYHGDLKPSNIMISMDGQVKLIDFGTAWVKGEEKNRIQGTPQYIAPEQVSERIVDERTDMYNLGATMYRMFTGKFVQKDLPKMGEKGIRRVTPPIEISPKIPGTLNETIMACLELNPDKRPAGMFEIKNQLAAVARYLGLKESDLKEAVEEE